MAVSLATEVRPDGGTLIKSVALSATAANSTQVTLPPWTQVWEVKFIQSGGADDSGKIATEGTDGAAIDTDHWPVASGASYYPPAAPVDPNRGGDALFLTAATNSATARFVIRG